MHGTKKKKKTPTPGRKPTDRTPCLIASILHLANTESRSESCSESCRESCLTLIRPAPASLSQWRLTNCTCLLLAPLLRASFYSPRLALWDASRAAAVVSSSDSSANATALSPSRSPEAAATVGLRLVPARKPPTLQPSPPAPCRLHPQAHHRRCIFLCQHQASPCKDAPKLVVCAANLLLRAVTFPPHPQQ